MSEYSNLNIYQKMAAITAELRTVAKNLNVETTKGKGYKAVSEVDVLNAVRPLEEKYGIYSFPCLRDVLESAMLESETQYGKKTTFFERIQTIYRFVNVDNPSEYLDTTTFAEGIDSQDKGSGKAMTYSDKYALMKAYKIRTGDDPDAEGSEEVHYHKTNGQAVFDEIKQNNNYVATISQLLADTETSGTEMLKYVNEKFGTDAKAFKELSAKELVFIIQALTKKKEKK